MHGMDGKIGHKHQHSASTIITTNTGGRSFALVRSVSSHAKGQSKPSPYPFIMLMFVSAVRLQCAGASLANPESITIQFDSEEALLQRTTKAQGTSARQKQSRTCTKCRMHLRIGALSCPMPNVHEYAACIQEQKTINGS